MPIFEYICKGCDQRFEKLVQGSSTPIECPACSSTRLDKQLSVFAPGKASASFETNSQPRPCGSCGDPRGPGSCSIN
ncbi:MAG TPA: zinc ribbon domain-containing protein [Blastocatellia bacterium]|nr:zinc ribbon domain-containing protein [Blastocatellia bacterium]